MPASATPNTRVPSAPRWKRPLAMSRIASKTTTSTRLIIDVSTAEGISLYWSESTPIAKRWSLWAATNTPWPVEPDAWIEPELCALAARRSWQHGDRAVALAELSDEDAYDGGQFATSYRRARYPEGNR